MPIGEKNAVIAGCGTHHIAVQTRDWDASLKLYVTASPRVRAERRVNQVGGDVDEVEASIIKRDRFDSSREHSPLTEATGSKVVDTTGMTIDEVVDHILELLEAAR